MNELYYKKEIISDKCCKYTVCRTDGKKYKGSLKPFIVTL